jgi:hypothetical protein
MHRFVANLKAKCKVLILPVSDLEKNSMAYMAEMNR